MTQVPDALKQATSARVLARFGIRIVVIGAFAMLGGVGFERSFATLLAMSAIFCGVAALLRRETPFDPTLTNWDEGAIYGALYCLASAMTYATAS